MAQTKVILQKVFDEATILNGLFPKLRETSFLIDKILALGEDLRSSYGVDVRLKVIYGGFNPGEKRNTSFVTRVLKRIGSLLERVKEECAVLIKAKNGFNLIGMSIAEVDIACQTVQSAINAELLLTLMESLGTETVPEAIDLGHEQDVQESASHEIADVEVDTGIDKEIIIDLSNDEVDDLVPLTQAESCLVKIVNFKEQTYVVPSTDEQLTSSEDEEDVKTIDAKRQRLDVD